MMTPKGSQVNFEALRSKASNDVGKVSTNQDHSLPSFSRSAVIARELLERSFVDSKDRDAYEGVYLVLENARLGIWLARALMLASSRLELAPSIPCGYQLQFRFDDTISGTITERVEKLEANFLHSIAKMELSDEENIDGELRKLSNSVTGLLESIATECSATDATAKTRTQVKEECKRLESLFTEYAVEIGRIWKGELQNLRSFLSSFHESNELGNNIGYLKEKGIYPDIIEDDTNHWLLGTIAINSVALGPLKGVYRELDGLRSTLDCYLQYLEEFESPSEQHLPNGRISHRLPLVSADGDVLSLIRQGRSVLCVAADILFSSPTQLESQELIRSVFYFGLNPRIEDIPLAIFFIFKDFHQSSSYRTKDGSSYVSWANYLERLSAEKRAQIWALPLPGMKALVRAGKEVARQDYDYERWMGSPIEEETVWVSCARGRFDNALWKVCSHYCQHGSQRERLFALSIIPTINFERIPWVSQSLQSSACGTGFSLERWHLFEAMVFAHMHSTFERYSFSAPPYVDVVLNTLRLIDTPPEVAQSSAEDCLFNLLWGLRNEALYHSDFEKVAHLFGKDVSEVRAVYFTYRSIELERINQYLPYEGFEVGAEIILFLAYLSKNPRLKEIVIEVTDQETLLIDGPINFLKYSDYLNECSNWKQIRNDLAKLKLLWLKASYQFVCYEERLPVSQSRDPLPDREIFHADGCEYQLGERKPICDLFEQVLYRCGKYLHGMTNRRRSIGLGSDEYRPSRQAVVLALEEVRRRSGCIPNYVCDSLYSFKLFSYANSRFEPLVSIEREGIDRYKRENYFTAVTEFALEINKLAGGTCLDRSPSSELLKLTLLSNSVVSLLSREPSIASEWLIRIAKVVSPIGYSEREIEIVEFVCRGLESFLAASKQKPNPSDQLLGVLVGIAERRLRLECYTLPSSDSSTQKNELTRARLILGREIAVLGALLAHAPCAEDCQRCLNLNSRNSHFTLEAVFASTHLIETPRDFAICMELWSSFFSRLRAYEATQYAQVASEELLGKISSLEQMAFFVEELGRCKDLRMDPEKICKCSRLIHWEEPELVDDPVTWLKSTTAFLREAKSILIEPLYVEFLVTRWVRSDDTPIFKSSQVGILKEIEQTTRNARQELFSVPAKIFESSNVWWVAREILNQVNSETVDDVAQIIRNSSGNEEISRLPSYWRASEFYAPQVIANETLNDEALEKIQAIVSDVLKVYSIASAATLENALSESSVRLATHLERITRRRMQLDNEFLRREEAVVRNLLRGMSTIREPHYFLNQVFALGFQRELAAPIRRILISASLAVPDVARAASKIAQGEPEAITLQFIAELVQDVINPRRLAELWKKELSVKELGEISRIFGAKLLGDLASRQVRIDPMRRGHFRLAPTRGIIAELSGLICNTCWIREPEITKKFPQLVFVPILQLKEGVPQGFAGGFLVLETTLRNEEKAFLVRGFNPSNGCLQRFSAAAIFEQSMDQLCSIAKFADVTKIVIPDEPRPFEAQTNRYQVNGHILQNYPRRPRVRFRRPSETTFNGKVVYDRCIVVRDLSAKQ